MNPFGLRAEQRAYEQTSYGHYCNKVRQLDLEPIRFVQFTEKSAELFHLELNRKERMNALIEFTQIQPLNLKGENITHG